MYPSNCCRDAFARLLLGALLLLAGCSGGAVPPAQSSLGNPMADAVTGCRAGPDGGPLQADRGIGGTGAPSVQMTDRGIGGTGIIGVITGFASVCIGGREVAYDPAVPVAINERAAAAADLRAGQVAAVEASGPETDLRAGRVAIRHEVVGPLESQDPAGMVRVAGQLVAVAASTLGDRSLRPGEWVAVSGFRGPDGVIHATRIDRSRAGDVEIRGVLQREGGMWRIGMIEVRFSPALRPVPNSPVLLDGHYAGGVVYADGLWPDRWEPGVAGVPMLFTPGVQVVVVESFAGYSDGRLVVGRSLRDRGNAEIRRSVIELERHPDGSLQPARSRTLGPAGSLPAANGPAAGLAGAGSIDRTGRQFAPAPVPARDMGLSREPSARANRPGFGGSAGDRFRPTGVGPEAAPSRPPPAPRN